MTYNEHVFQASQIFAKELLSEVPELLAIAVVPAWKVQQEHLPYGVVAGQKGPLDGPVENTRMLEALLGLVGVQYRNVAMVLQEYDRMMTTYAREFRDKEQQLEQLNQQIAAADEALTGKKEEVRATGRDTS